MPLPLKIFTLFAIILSLCLFVYTGIQRSQVEVVNEIAIEHDPIEANPVIHRKHEEPSENIAAETETTENKTDLEAHSKEITVLETAESVDEKVPDILQSSARPRGLIIREFVQAAASDEASRAFAENALPDINDFLEGVFEERATIDESAPNLMLEDLILDRDAHVRVYFVKEGTVFHNSLGLNAKDEPYLIFPDASSAHSYYTDKDTRAEETREDIPLIPGDFVDLGLMNEGDLLDFFLIHDGANTDRPDEETPIFWAGEDRNADNTNHVKLHGVYDDNTLVIGFEDIPGGGDRDYNDLVIAVEITDPGE
ncbi:MAG: DUF4114 domain-containing protein [Opitutales bacterium]